MKLPDESLKLKTKHMKTYSISVDFKGSGVCRIELPTYVKARVHTSDRKTLSFKEDDCIPVVKRLLERFY